jgi:glucan 1,3-beta-glucosidase
MYNKAREKKHALINIFGSFTDFAVCRDGSTFIYQNQFGGYWVSEPFNDSAQAQSYSPPLNQPWDYSSDK